MSRIALSVEILKRFSGQTLSVLEVARRTGEAWSVVWRTLRGMARRHQAVRLDDGRYRLGIVEG